jgi:hypothetical protein
MTVLVRQRDENVERIPREGKEVLGLFTFTSSSGHGGILAIVGIANNGIVHPVSGTEFATCRTGRAKVARPSTRSTRT